MLKWILFFVAITILAGILGFGGATGALATMAQIVFLASLLTSILALLISRKIIV